MNEKIKLSEDEWKKRLTGEQFLVCRKKGTEQAFTGEYYNFKEDGIYKCICCGNELFNSKTKFESGSGWPSFWDVINKDNIKVKEDNSHFMKRIELLCNKCDAHLGHIFADGPPPTKLRYCINSVSLKFEKQI